MTTAKDDQRIALVDWWRRRGTGSGYLIGRVDGGDHRLDALDAGAFGEFFATNHGDWPNVADLYERFIREHQSGKDGSK